MAADQNRESQERNKESQGTEKYGSAPGSSGTGKLRVNSNTPENRRGEMNPSSPTEATEGPSTNLAEGQTGREIPAGAARGESKGNEGTIKKPSAEKHEAA